MAFEVGDDDLVRMSTSELRMLLSKRQLTAEEYRHLRSRRRRLQNRKYARKCAHKKVTELRNLTTKVNEETSELKALKNQLRRLNLKTQHLQNQATGLARFRFGLQACKGDQSSVQSVRMLSPNGETVGFARSTKPSASTLHTASIPILNASLGTNGSSGVNNACTNSALTAHSPCSVSVTSYSTKQYHSTMPVQLAAGLGMPSNQNPFPYVWSSSGTDALDARHPLRLVRPVGCGGISSGRNGAEY